MSQLFYLLWGTLLALLITASITDMRNRIIPNWLIVIGIASGLIEHIAYQGVGRGLFLSLTGLFVWLVAGFLVWQTGKISGGDVKLFIMIATFTGISGVPWIAFIAVIVQFAVYLIQFARGHMRLDKPFAPAITIGSLVFMVLSTILR
jgi:Flp pilus assembly protein protease CpaA